MKNPSLDPAKVNKRDKDIHPCALEYLAADETYKEAKAEKDAAREALVAVMNRKGRSTYIADCVDVEISESVSVKAKRTPESTE